MENANRPTPDLRRLNVVHYRRGSSVPRISSGSLMNLWSREWFTRHSSYKRCLIYVCLDVSGSESRRSWWACPAKAWLDFSRARWGGSQTVLWRRRSASRSALRASARTAASWRSAAGAMPDRIGRWLTGVARRDPETVRKELFSATPSFFVCGLLHQTGTQYSAAEKTRAWVEMRRVFVAAPQVVLARRRIRETRDVVFADIFSRCCWKARAGRASLQGTSMLP